MTNGLPASRANQESATWVIFRMFLLQGLLLSAGLMLILMVI